MLSEKLVLDTAKETVSRFHEVWRAEKKNLPMPTAAGEAIEKHIRTVPIVEEFTAAV